MVKYIFVTGGVTSSLGKGILAASLAKLLQSRGLRVTIQKFDPYINVDPGTMNPYEHGECYVTEDGAETDLDLGHYERFLDIHMSQANNVTAGRVFSDVIDKERNGEFLGKTVQIIPHITDEIKSKMLRLGKTGKYDIVITEIGGTVGDIESLPFIEAVRQLRWELKKDCYLVLHLTLVPYLKAAKELKTKPTQRSVRDLQENGIQPDIVACRSEYPLDKNIRNKIALFCNVDQDSVIQALDAETIYDVPLDLKKENLDKIVLEKLGIKKYEKTDLKSWINFLKKFKNPTKEIKIGFIGKYIELQDAYKSIYESFNHAGAAKECQVNIEIIHSEQIDKFNLQEKLSSLDGIMVAPGFGLRGIEGKIEAIRFARENNIPFFGICLGMQMAVVEFAQNVLKLEGANSREMGDSVKNAVIDIMESQKNIKKKGGTMRLGSYPCEISKGTKAYDAYKKTLISERHRHRYEFNNKYLAQFEEAGMIASGINPESKLVEIIELKNHPWFIGCQFHPEFKSTVLTPHPLFVSFVEASIAKKYK
jgi:CTP synthase